MSVNYGSQNSAFAGMQPSIGLTKSRTCDVRHFSPQDQEPCFAERRILLVGCACGNSSSILGVHGPIFQSHCSYTADPTKTTCTALPARARFVHEARGPRTCSGCTRLFMFPGVVPLVAEKVSPSFGVRVCITPSFQPASRPRTGARNMRLSLSAGMVARFSRQVASPSPCVFASLPFRCFLLHFKLLCRPVTYNPHSAWVDQTFAMLFSFRFSMFIFPVEWTPSEDRAPPAASTKKSTGNS